MTTLHPRNPYSDEELQKLFPPHLRLEHVQIVRNMPSHTRPPTLITSWYTPRVSFHIQQTAMALEVVLIDLFVCSYYGMVYAIPSNKMPFRITTENRGMFAKLDPTSGERSPVTPRFQNVSLPAVIPQEARLMKMTGGPCTL